MKFDLDIVNMSWEWIRIDSSHFNLLLSVSLSPRLLILNQIYSRFYTNNPGFTFPMLLEETKMRIKLLVLCRLWITFTTLESSSSRLHNRFSGFALTAPKHKIELIHTQPNFAGLFPIPSGMIVILLWWRITPILRIICRNNPDEQKLVGMKDNFVACSPKERKKWWKRGKLWI